MSSEVISLSALSDPARQRRAAMAKKVTAVTRLKTSSDATAKHIAKASGVADRVHATFASSKLTSAKIGEISVGLRKLFAAVARTEREAARHLASAIAMDVPTAKMLSRFEAAGTLRTKVAGLIIQAQASTAESVEDIQDDLIPVDESGYVVAPATPAATPSASGPQDEVTIPTAAADEGLNGDPAGIASPDVPVTDLSVAGDDLELDDQSSGIDLDDLDVTADMDQCVAELLEDAGLPEGNVEPSPAATVATPGQDPHTNDITDPAIARAARATAARQASALPRVGGAPAMSDEAALAALVSDMVNPGL